MTNETDRGAVGEIPRRSHAGPARLSFGQEQLWLIDRASPGTTAWNVTQAFRLRGPLDIDALQAAIDALRVRHEVLRTVYTDTTDGPCAIVLPAAMSPIRRIDLSVLEAEARVAAAERIVTDERARPFELGVDAPLRVVLATLADNDHVLCVVTHHIVFDGWSANVMFRDLSAFYAAFLQKDAASLPPLPIQFSDYAAWERGPEHQAELTEKIAFWRGQLADAPQALSLPTYRQRPLVATHGAARSVIILPPELVESVTVYAREQKVTVYFVLLATYVALLARYSGQDDILVGSPIAGRARGEIEDLIGFFVNTLVLRTRLEDDPTFVQLLARVRATFFNSYEHQDVPVEQIVLEVRKERELTLAPLFNAILNMESVLPDLLALPGIAVEPIESDQRATKFDFTLLAALLPEGLRLALWYRSDLFLKATADGFLAHFRRLLEAAIADPSVPTSMLPLVDASERRALVGPTAPPVRSEPTRMPERFAEVVRAQPGALALVCGKDRRTYGELDATARRVKRRLEALGVGRGALVGLALDRSADAIGALLGIWQAGAAYVPLTPDLPVSRLLAIAKECGLRFVIADTAQLPRIAAAGLESVLIDADGEKADVSADSSIAHLIELHEDLAYVIFTSGSTGVPKGVAVTHRNLASYVEAITQRLNVGAEDRWRFASVSSLGADLGNTTVFPALATGGTLHIVPADVATDAESYAQWASAEPVDVLKITPSHLAALLACSDRNTLPRRWLVLGGEVCPTALVSRVQALSACAILNHYGPTETTVGACTYVVGEDQSGPAERANVPIGYPLAGVRCYVLDRHGEPVPLAVPGELFIGGVGVAQGYIRRPELTQARFLPDPFATESGARMYRTGDRVRRLPGGELEFLGRNDDQVKIRGYRVELGEIESALGAHPDVAQSAASLQLSGAGEPHLVAYVTLQAGQGLDASGQSLRDWLAQRLPDYMIPIAVNVLEGLPLKPNGKLDRGALEKLCTAVFPAQAFDAPRTPTERRIAAIWQEVLGVERVSVSADFLSLGFHSLLAIRALARLGRSLAIRVPIRTFFESKTIERLAVAIDAEARRAAEIEFERSLGLVESLDDVDVLALLAEPTIEAAR